MAADGSVRLPVDDCDALAGFADFAVRISVQSHGADRIAAGRASLTMDIFGEHPSIPIGVAILIAIYLGACRAAGRKPTRRQAMWFALAMGAILFTHTELDELADARIFSMHMLQHLMQTFVIPPLILLGTPGWMLGPWMLSRPIKPDRALAHESGNRVPDFFGGLRHRALSADLRSDVPRREFSHFPAPALHGVRHAAVVADSESAPRAAAALVPGADPLPVPADDPDDGGGRADHAGDESDLSVVHRGRARMGPQGDRRPGAGRADHVDRAGHLSDDRFHIHLLQVVAARRPRYSGSACSDELRSFACCDRAASPARKVAATKEGCANPFARRTASLRDRRS